MFGRTGRRIALTVTALALLAPASANAVVFHVNSTKDKPDVTDVDSKCEAANGKCTLRAAVAEANVQPGPDVIKLPKGTYVLTIPGSNGVAQGDLDVFESVALVGAGASKTTVVQTVHDRILESTGAAALAVGAMKLTGGRATTNGGAIYSGGPLAVDRSTLSGNRATGKDLSGAAGGAIRANSSLTMIRSRVTGNSAVARKGTADGGGILYDGLGSGESASIDRTLIAGNVAKKKGAATDAVGGGIAFVGPGTMTRSTVRDNIARHGAGIFSNSTDLVTIDRSLVAGNKAETAGGGVNMGGLMTIINSTLTGNRVTAGPEGGGAIFRFNGTLAVEYSTIAGNSSPLGGGISSTATAGGVNVLAAIFDQNQGGNCFGASTIGSFGYNVDRDGSCQFGGTGDVAHKNPRLAPLGRNGGPTQTMALKKGSPAIDRVASGCPDPPTDQRGVSRPHGPRCDSGAYEKN